MRPQFGRAMLVDSVADETRPLGDVDVQELAEVGQIDRVRRLSGFEFARVHRRPHLRALAMDDGDRDPGPATAPAPSTGCPRGRGGCGRGCVRPGTSCGRLPGPCLHRPTASGGRARCAVRGAPGRRADRWPRPFRDAGDAWSSPRASPGPPALPAIKRHDHGRCRQRVETVDRPGARDGHSRHTGVLAERLHRIADDTSVQVELWASRSNGSGLLSRCGSHVRDAPEPFSGSARKRVCEFIRATARLRSALVLPGASRAHVLPRGSPPASPSRRHRKLTVVGVAHADDQARRATGCRACVGPNLDLSSISIERRPADVDDRPRRQARCFT